MRTVEDARLEVATYVEVKFGLRIRDSKPSDKGAREHSDPMDVGAVNSLSLVVWQRKRVIDPRDGCFNCGGAHIPRDCNARKSTGKQLQSKSWSESEGKGKRKENKEKSKGTKGSHKGKTSKTGLSGLDNLKSETSSETQESVHMGQVCTTETSWIHDEWSPHEWNDGWSLDEWNDDWSGVGWHEDCEQTYNTSVSSFSLESSAGVNANLDTGAAVNAFLVNFDREGVGDGSFFDWIPDGEAWQFQGYDENSLPRSLNGKLARNRRHAQTLRNLHFLE